MLLKRNNFSKKLNYYILEGSKNQKEKDFRKSAAICGYAIVFSSVVPIKDWNKQVFDRVIKEGHAFYDSCLNELIRTGRIIYFHLEAYEILWELNLNSKVFKLSEYIDYKKFLEYKIKKHGNLYENDLVNQLEEFIYNLNSCQSLLITINSLTMAIIKHLDFVYLVDSQEHGECAYVKKFHKRLAAEEIKKHVVRLFPDRVLGCSFYTIIFIKVL